LDTSNWINLGIFVITGLVGLLSWYGARKAAREARTEQRRANDAADRSATAAQRSVEIELKRDADSAIEARRARLRVERKRVQGSRREMNFMSIINGGSAAASNIQLELNGTPYSEWQAIMGTKMDADLKIGAFSHFDIKVPAHDGRAKFPFKIVMAWDDDSGMRGNWVGTLN
jgi:hypothetical protein